MKITIGMPVKPYLKKYVYWKENLSEDEVLDLHPSSHLRMVLDALLTGKMQIYHADKATGSIVRDVTDEIICKVTPYTENKQLLFFGEAQVRWFNSFIYKEFHDDLLYSIMLNKNFGIAENKTIHAFIDSVGIDEAITFDALKKASYRVRKNRKLPVFRFQKCRVASNPYQFLVPGDSSKI